MSNLSEEIKVTRSRLNDISKSYCVAKWKQVTIHLHTGQTHSCHHPGTHTVPLEELKSNPSALHNTKYKKSLRKMMLNGQKPAECQYCWDIEKLGPEFLSDRHIKSNDSWAKPYLEELPKLPWDHDVSPSYVEVSFSHNCNFKCLYCYPHISSSWQAEVNKFGHIELDRPLHKIDWWKQKGLEPRPDDNNPYVEAFWKWLPSLYPSLQELRVTGGEPLLSENTFRLLDYIKKNPHPNLNLAINSNLGTHQRFVDRLSNSINEIKTQVNSVRLYTSIDTWGKQAEYIRTGLDLDVFQKNIEQILTKVKDLKLTFMCTFNLLSFFHFDELLTEVLKLKRKYGPNSAEIFLDISYLRHPEFLSPLLASDSMKSTLFRALDFMLKNPRNWETGEQGFMEYEVEKLKRLIEFVNQGEPYFDINTQKKSFVLFYKEIDRRRNTSFESSFPQAKDMLNDWSLSL